MPPPPRDPVWPAWDGHQQPLGCPLCFLPALVPRWPPPAAIEQRQGRLSAAQRRLQQRPGRLTPSASLQAGSAPPHRLSELPAAVQVRQARVWRLLALPACSLLRLRARPLLPVRPAGPGSGARWARRRRRRAAAARQRRQRPTPHSRATAAAAPVMRPSSRSRSRRASSRRPQQWRRQRRRKAARRRRRGPSPSCRAQVRGG